MPPAQPEVNTIYFPYIPIIPVNVRESLGMIREKKTV